MVYRTPARKETMKILLTYDEARSILFAELKRKKLIPENAKMFTRLYALKPGTDLAKLNSDLIEFEFETKY